MIETLVATALLGIVVIAYVYSLQTASRGAGLLEETTVARSLAISKMELVKQYTYADGKKLDNSVAPDGLFHAAYTGVADPAGGLGAYTIQVTASWFQGSTTEQEIIIDVRLGQAGRGVYSLKTIKVGP